MNTNAFLPENYEVPSSGGYTKLEAGDNKFRILSNALLVWVCWVGGESTRLPYTFNGAVTPKPSKGNGEKDSVRHAWCVVVWNYATEKVEIMEITQQTILKSLSAYAKEPSWGHPSKYDIVINKKGSGLDTEYIFRGNPPSPIDANIAAAQADTPIDLNQLLVKDGDPFLSSSPAAAQPQAPQQAQPNQQAPAQTPPPPVEAGQAPPF